MFPRIQARFLIRRLLPVCVPAMLLLLVPLWGAAPAPPAPSTRPDRSPTSLHREYQERFERLAPGDMQGHYALAEWCLERRLYRTLLKQSQYLLKLDPDNENARLLYKVAVQKLRSQNAQSQPGEEGESPDGELLSPTQIQKLKWAEFMEGPTIDWMSQDRPLEIRRRRRSDREDEEFLKVRFAPDVLNDFLDQMSGHRDFSRPVQRTRFLTLPPTLQTQIIRKQTGWRYQDDIEIVNDPLVFRRFQRVLPLVINGCGTTYCHGGPEAEGWRLRTARPRTDLNLYTNFLILTRVRKGGERLVNRAKPDESLLLQYGLPPERASLQHSELIPIVFPQGRRDSRYRTILEWIEMLRMPEPENGVSLAGYPAPPPPQFGGSPPRQETPRPAPAPR